jgi:probable phosphoglycerate mutase
VQGGGSDTELGERGREQAKQVAQALRKERIDAIYSSSLKRAIETAKAIADYHQLKVIPVPDLKELHTGQLEGVSLEKTRQSLFQYVVEREQGEGFLKLPGGESLTDLNERVSSTLARILARHTEGVVVLVSHYFVLLTIICNLMLMPLSHLSKLRIEPGGVSVLHIENGRTCLVSFNIPI